jgi:hypothetical protein
LVTVPLRGALVLRWANRALPTLSLDHPLSPHQTAQLVAWRDSEPAANVSIAMSRAILVYARQCWLLSNPASAATNGVEQRVIAVRCAKGWRTVLCGDIGQDAKITFRRPRDAESEADEENAIIVMPGTRVHRPPQSLDRYRHAMLTREAPMCATVVLYPWLGGLLVRASSVSVAGAVDVDATTRPALPLT